ncbi:hypothetical protein [Streptomyces sp. UNOB3_S3]|uniref:hypothetical protein n=1 Tax=Streptomyces sp. UNOB3_S3 TaxID=2871682 RepID=UPI001E46E97C|nr:hypothetical protein [Streptomyces sp. UNOB3_S3]MCC3778097.1 hypothetical protein [Streptomyces sp. UNOB3_S3]
MNRFLRPIARTLALMAALLGLGLAPTVSHADPRPVNCSAALPAMSGVVDGHLANDPVAGLRMETWVVVDRDSGRIDTTTHARSLFLAKGFTASSLSVAYDACGRAIALTPPLNTSVDAIWSPFGKSDRWKSTHLDMDRQLTRRIARIEVVNAHSPVSAQEIYNRWKPVVCDAVRTISRIVGKPISCP